MSSPVRLSVVLTVLVAAFVTSPALAVSCPDGSQMCVTKAVTGEGKTTGCSTGTAGARVETVAVGCSKSQCDKAAGAKKEGKPACSVDCGKPAAGQPVCCEERKADYCPKSASACTSACGGGQVALVTKCATACGCADCGVRAGCGPRAEPGPQTCCADQVRCVIVRDARRCGPQAGCGPQARCGDRGCCGMSAGCPSACCGDRTPGCRSARSGGCDFGKKCGGSARAGKRCSPCRASSGCGQAARCGQSCCGVARALLRRASRRLLLDWLVWRGQGHARACRFVLLEGMRCEGGLRAEMRQRLWLGSRR